MLDKHGGEAFLVLDLHAVENTAVGIDADEELFAGTVVAQNLGWVVHKFFSEVTNVCMTGRSKNLKEFLLTG